ncbi:MAG: T9SS type A sorting domain-containing protein, partial [Bacteroidota bacterium]
DNGGDDDNGDDNDDDDNGGDDDNGDDNDDDDNGGDDDNDDDNGGDDDNGDVPQNMASIQIIHNSPDPIISGIDIDINGEIVAQNLTFRSATAFFQIPIDRVTKIGFAPSNGFGGKKARIERIVRFEGGKRYVLMASGVLLVNQFDRSVNRNIRANVFTLMPARKVSVSGNGHVDLVAFHGTTDAVEMDVYLPQIQQTTVDDLSYGGFTEYVTVPAIAGQVQLDVMNGNQSEMFGTFYGDLSLFTGQAITIFASGFMNPQRNRNGANFGLFAALPNGTVIELEGGSTENRTSKIKLKKLVKLSPNPAKHWVNITLEDWEMQPLSIQLFSATGQLVREQELEIYSSEQQLQWNISDLPSMIYTVKITQGERVITQQLGVQ